ncbi:MAG: hypothetical protein WEC84_01225 [Candidatus Andersenbacteria bacterium]
MNLRAWARGYNHLLLQLAKQPIIRNYRRYCLRKKGHALLYYKTDVFTPGYIHDYSHTNHWEIAEIARILNEAGFWVDIIDRSVDVKRTTIHDKYDVCIANGPTDSTADYPLIAKQTSHAIKVFYATAAAPKLHNAQLLERHARFTARTGTSLPPRRLMEHIDMPLIMDATDVIFSVGSPWTNASYAQYSKPIYPINVSTAPFLYATQSEIKQKDSHHFLFLAGNGNILKGLDIVLEAFASIPKTTLHVCTVIEDDIARFYRSLLASNPHIRLHGFLPLRGRTFRDISRVSRFSLLPSSTEATATAGATCLRRGIIPIMTEAVGLERSSSYAYLLPSHPTPVQLTKTIEQALAEKEAELLRRAKTGYDISNQYTQKSFTNTFQKALNAILR